MTENTIVGTWRCDKPTKFIQSTFFTMSLNLVQQSKTNDRKPADDKLMKDSSRRNYAIVILLLLTWPFLFEFVKYITIFGFMVKPHKSDIRITYEYIRVTHRWYASTYECFFNLIRGGLTFLYSIPRENICSFYM